MERNCPWYSQVNQFEKNKPVRICPSTCTTTLERRSLRTRVWWVSERPSSHGNPACLMPVQLLAPVPPSCPEMVIWPALAYRNATKQSVNQSEEDQSLNTAWDTAMGTNYFNFIFLSLAYVLGGHSSPSPSDLTTDRYSCSCTHHS